MAVKLVSQIKYINLYRTLPFYYIIVAKKRLSLQHRAILIQHLPFYQKLNNAEKEKFEKRLVRFMRFHRFIGRHIEVTDEMKIIISGLATMVLYGLPGFYLRDFPTILIYPDKYYSTISKKYHHGEVNPKAGFIVLSWKAVEEGLRDHTDGRNLAIHEMTHALHLADLRNSRENDLMDHNYMADFKKIAVYLIPKLREDPDPFLREYATTNVFEFFAVCVEHFFEQPEQFKIHHPELYRVICGLLAFDILQIGRQIK